MIVTSREKAIIELLVKRSGYHSIQSIATHLHISTRTVQREIKSVEKILKEFDLTKQKYLSSYSNALESNTI